MLVFSFFFFFFVYSIELSDNQYQGKNAIKPEADTAVCHSGTGHKAISKQYEVNSEMIIYDIWDSCTDCQEKMFQ